MRGGLYIQKKSIADLCTVGIQQQLVPKCSYQRQHRSPVIKTVVIGYKACIKCILCVLLLWSLRGGQRRYIFISVILTLNRNE